MTTRRRPLRRASLLTSVLKALALGVLLVVLASGFSEEAPPRAEPPSAVRLDLDMRGLDRVMGEHDCTTTGYGDTASPRSALIRRDGHVEHVSFEQAWAVFTGKRPGELLAVCLSEVPGG